ncbi:MAG: amidase [Pseudomonadota bacterium]
MTSTLPRLVELEASLAGLSATFATPAKPEDEVRRALADIAAQDGRFRAFISVDQEGAVEAARAATERRREGHSLGPLDGVPVAVKDNLKARGTITTGGHSSAGLLPDKEDATVVAGLRRAGAVIVGKANLHEGALGATNANPHHGDAINPLAEGHTPGGSSGGSAAAVAAGFVPVALGTDTMGSVRIPAACCGLLGLKPTRGLVGRTGLSPLSPTLDTIGPIARSVAGLAAALSAIVLEDENDPDWLQPQQRHPPRMPEHVASLRIGVPTNIQSVEMEPAVRDAFSRAQAAMAATGASVEAVEIAGWEPGAARRAGLLIAEAEAAMSLGEAIEREPERFGAEFRQLVEYGSAVPAVRLAAAYNTVRRVGSSAQKTLCAVDILLMPTAPQQAFPHGEPVPANQADLTALANFAGLPALALPVPCDGLPASVQLVGPQWSEAALLGYAAQLGKMMGAASEGVGAAG